MNRSQKTIIKIMGKTKYNRIAKDMAWIIIICLAFLCFLFLFAGVQVYFCEKGSVLECLVGGRFK